MKEVGNALILVAFLHHSEADKLLYSCETGH
jgi:hypothetical protein